MSSIIFSMATAHSFLIRIVFAIFEPTVNPIPITIVSIGDKNEDQLVIYDDKIVSLESVVERLRKAADLIQSDIDNNAPDQYIST